MAGLAAACGARPTIPPAPAPECAGFRGEVTRGGRFDAAGPAGLSVALAPIPHGWRIEVRGGGPDGVLPIPRFGPREPEIEGWHFRNSDNSGPNAPGPKNVNAPQEDRTFVFRVATAVDSVAGAGRVLLDSLELGNLDGERAWIERMAFRGCACAGVAEPPPPEQIEQCRPADAVGDSTESDGPGGAGDPGEGDRPTRARRAARLMRGRIRADRGPLSTGTPIGYTHRKKTERDTEPHERRPGTGAGGAST